MYKYEVAGREIPMRVAGAVGLELCNTAAGWADGAKPRVEYLLDFDTAILWAQEAGLISEPEGRSLARLAAKDADASSSAVRGLRQLRSAVRAAALGTAQPAQIARIGNLATRARAHQRLTLSGGRAAWVFDKSAGLDLPLYAAALTAVDVLSSDAVGRISACPGQGCGWLFHNATGRRRWCSMAVCGNRAKARAFAARERAT